ncbi:MAG: DUF3142 domain-containing protein [Blastocatellia bacterium]|nr:DUF3142 domain-containing protein [Blastocatellia bacterium]MCS7158271.1 DUF3142 domain-containing protein [Blastocatellia bacterium]MCX7753109.1 DUF3142 domain-containing protein [Blastocatellia bacterium]MDW8169423.1 DUF3142 domain-containing protein [Acidobacteriota bacterium]MDW8255698.1 DUF3142 domain-containing protein [Acidobacteriota bacterium]
MDVRFGVRGFIACGLAIGSLSGCGPPEPERSRPLERAVWIEHAAWTATRDDERALRLIGPRRIFLKLGDLDAGDERLRWASEVRPKAPPLPSELICIIGGTTRFVERLSRLSETSLAEQMVTLLREAIERAKNVGVSCAGLHLDLPAGAPVEQYERVLARVRARLPRPLTLSATIPIAWERERVLSDLLRRLDFFVLRLTSEEVPKNLASLRAGVDVREISSWIRRFERWGVPFYVEGRAQGQCFLLDSEGKVIFALGAAHPLSLWRRFGLRLVESYPLGLAEVRMRVPTDFSGEYVVIMEARATSRVGEHVLRSGDRLACRLPTARAVRRQIEAIETVPGMWKRGYVLWYSEAALPLAQIALLVRGGAMEPKLQVQGEIRASSLVLRVENVGQQESALMPRAVEVRLRIEGAAVGRIERGDFTEVVREPDPDAGGLRLALYADGIGMGDVLRAAVKIAPRDTRVRLFAASRVRDPDDFITLSGPEVEVLSHSP